MEREIDELNELGLKSYSFSFSLLILNNKRLIMNP